MRTGAFDEEGVFAELQLSPRDSVARMTAPACREFSWGMLTQARLFLVERDGPCRQRKSQRRWWC